MEFKKFENSPNETVWKVGEKITFWTGYSDDIRAVATIKAIDGKDIYIFEDAYWFPIQDTKERCIKLD